MKPPRRSAPDRWLVYLPLAMTLAGIGFILSASHSLSTQRYGSPWHFAVRQTIWAGAALGLFALVAKTDWRVWARLGKPLYLLTAALLVLVLFAPEVAGVQRWFRIGPISLQPSELAKFASAAVLADHLDRRASRIKTGKGFLHAVGLAALPALLIAFQPDLGTPALLGGMAGVMLWLAGARKIHLFGLAVAAAALGGLAIWLAPWRLERLATFLNPFREARGAGYQLSQSLLAIGSGGLFGKGLGQGDFPRLFLPEAHTDFLFAVIAEETGFLGSSLVLAGFAALALKGGALAQKAPNQFGALFAVGLVAWLAGQALISFGVSAGLFPTKGLPLPFFAYGGTALVAEWAAVGVLVSLSRDSK